jgi:transcriptional regulator with XRE-family HTH domain
LTKVEKQYERFRALLVERRKSAGLTQVEVAALLKKDQSYVSKFESGVRRLDVVEFLAVAHVIGFNPAEFINELNSKPSHK